VGRVVVAADNDLTGTGQRNALVAYDRWRAEGRSVRIVVPAAADTDFNTVLLLKGRGDVQH
jgi:hypothetical protein